MAQICAGRRTGCFAGERRNTVAGHGAVENGCFVVLEIVIWWGRGHVYRVNSSRFVGFVKRLLDACSMQEVVYRIACDGKRR